MYRITGVLTVIAGWFLTALIAFTIAFLVALGLMWGGMIAVVLFACLCAYLLVQSSILHSRKVKKQAEKMAEEGKSCEEILQYFFTDVSLEEVTDIVIEKNAKGE